MILGYKFQHGGTVVLDQHFFPVFFHGADAHVQMLGDLFPGQAFPGEHKDFLAARRKFERGHGFYHHYLLKAHHINNAAHAEFFADVGKMLVQRPFGDEQFCRNDFLALGPAPAFRRPHALVQSIPSWQPPHRVFGRTQSCVYRL